MLTLFLLLNKNERSYLIVKIVNQALFVENGNKRKFFDYYF